MREYLRSYLIVSQCSILHFIFEPDFNTGFLHESLTCPSAQTFHQANEMSSTVNHVNTHQLRSATELCLDIVFLCGHLSFMCILYSVHEINQCKKQETLIGKDINKRKPMN